MEFNSLIFYDNGDIKGNGIDEINEFIIDGNYDK